MPPENVSGPCPRPQAQQGTLLHSTSPRDASAAGYGKSLWARRELWLLLQRPMGKRDTTGESPHISPSFKRFFSNLKQSTSEAIIALPSKTARLMALDTPAHCLCLPLKFASKISQLTSTYAAFFTLHPIALLPSSLHAAEIHFHQEADSFLHSRTCTSIRPNICLLPHLTSEDFRSDQADLGVLRNQTQVDAFQLQ